jgi:peptidoglycan/xylan/chitin deacetylase (PgdA/CDA1 family)
LKNFKTPGLLKWIFPKRIWGFSVSEPTIFLTFDDGPCPKITTWVLDELLKHNIKACFFCVGENVERYPEILSRIRAEGHQVGNHTYSHDKQHKVQWNHYLDSIEKTDKLLNTVLFRPPYGRLNGMRDRSISKKYKIVMWSWLSYDYDDTVSVEKIMKSSKKIKSGDILLLHDNQKVQERTKALLPELIQNLKSRGFTFALLPLD